MLAHRQLHAIRLHTRLDCTQSGCVKSRIAALLFALQDGALASARSTLCRKSERACPCLRKHSLAFHSIAFAATATATRRSRCYHNSNSVCVMLPHYITNIQQSQFNISQNYNKHTTTILPTYIQHYHNVSKLLTTTIFSQYFHNTTTSTATAKATATATAAWRAIRFLQKLDCTQSGHAQFWIARNFVYMILLIYDECMNE
jgi:hypothetical protein